MIVQMAQVESNVINFSTIWNRKMQINFKFATHSFAEPRTVYTCVYWSNSFGCTVCVCACASSAPRADLMPAFVAVLEWWKRYDLQQAAQDPPSGYFWIGEVGWMDISTGTFNKMSARDKDAPMPLHLHL